MKKGLKIYNEAVKANLLDWERKTVGVSSHLGSAVWREDAQSEIIGLLNFC